MKQDRRTRMQELIKESPRAQIDPQKSHREYRVHILTIAESSSIRPWAA